MPKDAYYGVQSLRGLYNYNITGVRLSSYRNFIKAFGMIKKACIIANGRLGLINKEIVDAVSQACDEVIEGKLDKYFIVDMIQGGAGTSTNMNANEVIANRALEIMGKNKGEYTIVSPNDHINKCQSTNDTYPSSGKLGMYLDHFELLSELEKLIEAFEKKAVEFKDVLKMGRTQLQDAVPMTLGQEFEAYAANLTEETERLTANMKLFFEINMGATAIGTGINADPDYAGLCTRYLREITGLPLVEASNMIEATSDTGAFIMNSSAQKRLAVKLSKICNDLRLLSSGPRCGLNEINLPPRQPGSSIMPGKVNPVIPEVVNQVAFRVIGNDLTVTIASEAGQLELNVMEPIIVHCLFESIEMLINAMNTLREKCIAGITANEEVCRRMVFNSIGLVTALNPYLGYETSSMLAKEALKTGKGIYDLVLEHKLMSEEELHKVLQPENMVHPRKKIGE